MPQDQGRPDGIDGPADDLQISAAQAHRADADHHVVCGDLRRFRNLSDLEWLTKRGQDCSFHTMTLPPATSSVMPVLPARSGYVGTGTCATSVITLFLPRGLRIIVYCRG